MAGKYTKLNVLGSGAFGKAWLVEHKQNNRKYVVKEVTVSGLADKERRQALTEVAALARCRHINVIRYREAFVDQGLLHIVMEHADGGDLQRKISSQSGTYFAEQIILDWFVQMCFALRYIHGLKILHRDLKTQNIFLTSDGLIKLGDFGIARFLKDTQDHAATAIGTPFYLSPEICQQQHYNQKSDIWALGCVLYELCCLAHPFDAPTFSALVMLILQAKYKPIPRQYNALLQDLVPVLLRVEADGRPSADQILCIPAIQPYVNSYVQKSMESRKLSVSSPNTSPAHSPRSKPRNRSRECSPLAMDNKENVDPSSSPREKRPRYKSPSTPKSNVLAENKNAANSTNMKRDKASDSPKVSLYKEALRKAAEKSSPISNICTQTYIIHRMSPKGSDTEPMEQDDKNDDGICEVLHKTSSVAGEGIHSMMETLRHQLECRMGSQKLIKSYTATVQNLAKSKSLDELKLCLDAQSIDNLPLLLNLAQLEILSHSAAVK